MARPETKIINQDGNRYEFTPGEGGRLLVRGKKQPPLQQIIEPRPKTGKVIGPSSDDDGFDDSAERPRMAKVIMPVRPPLSFRPRADQDPG